MSELSCPRCGGNTQVLQGLDPGLIAKLKEAGNTESFPPSVCENCFAELAGGVARGSVLLMREKAREQRRLMMWKSRVALIKKARTYMTDKMFSDAAITYEKYIRTLEVVFEVGPGELTPEQFKDSARTQELTVVASVYWDLLRIYDTSDKFRDRQAGAAKKLAEFIRFTPIYPDVIRKAEAFLRSAKNPSAIRAFLKDAAEVKSRCFIATAAFNGPQAPEVLALVEFRDRVLIHSITGRAFVKVYYLVSPAIACVLDNFSGLKAPVRAALRVFIRLTGRNTHK